jgi:rhodanese-related sulfurtransferase
LSDLSEPREVYARRDDVQLVDVREQEEWESGRIEGAVHIPLNELLAGRMEELSPDRPVVAYCRSGNRSEVAKLMLQARGFDAYNLAGGTEAWEATGLPITSPNPTAGDGD